ncbi:MAG: restriction endonuclease subunit S [Treponemataceae bacterium]
MNTKILRQKILDRAIKGTLVEQNPQLGCASDLLAQIRKEKEQKIAKGELIKDKKDSFIFKDKDGSHCEQFADGTIKNIDSEIPFEIPQNWAWCRLGEVCEYGKCSNINASNLKDNDWILDLEDIEKDTGKILCYKTFKERKSASSKHIFYKNQLLYSKLRPYLNKVLIAPKDGFCTSEILPLSFFGNLNDNFFHLVLTSPYFLGIVNILTYGVKMPRLGTDDAKKILIPLPPLEEQKRIVAAIEQYNEQIQIIEENYAQLQTMAGYTKSKMLDLALRGKITKQNTHETSAASILEQIRKEKEQKIAKGELIKDKKASFIFKDKDGSHCEHFADGTIKNIDSEIPFEIPQNWAWVKGGMLLEPMTSKKPQGDTFSYIDIESIDNKTHSIANPKILKTKNAPSRASRELKKGDTLFSLVRPYLENIAFVSEKYSESIASTGFYICRPSKIINPEFLFQLFTSNYVIKGLNHFMKGDNSPSISGDNIKNWLFPLPPLEEQKRIVTTLQKIFTQLETLT